MARRGEGQFIAAEVGLRHDPKVGSLARELEKLVRCLRGFPGLARAAAVGYVIAWRELVLVRGTGRGVVKDYGVHDLAAFTEWPGVPSTAARAFKRGGFLAVRRGEIAYPHWLETATGDYAKARGELRDYDRDRKREERRRGRGGGKEAANVSVRTSDGLPPDVHPESGDQSINGLNPEGPPPGAREPSALWDWFRRLYPKLENSKACRKLLADLTPTEEAHLRYALPIQAPIYLRTRERFRPGAVKYLTEQKWEQIKLPEPPDPAEAEERRKRREAEREKRRQEEEANQAAAERSRELLRRRLELKAAGKEQGLRGPELERWIDERMAQEGLN